MATKQQVQDVKEAAPQAQAEAKAAVKNDAASEVKAKNKPFYPLGAGSEPEAPYVAEQQ